MSLMTMMTIFLMRRGLPLVRLMSKKRKQASANEASETGEAEESAECENRRGRTIAVVVGKAILSGVKIPLEWNHKVPIGENRYIFSSYIGVVVCERVNINYRDWEEVPKEVIDDLYKFITRGFIVPEERRNYVLGRASIRWRAFKARLRKDWMYDTKGVNPNVIIKKPPSIYPLITQADWTKFIETYTDDAFKAAELQKQGVQVRDVPRHLVWIRAHSKQKDGAMTFDNPADFEIAQTIVKSIGGSTIQGEIEATGRNDILARALKNPEHGGCVRGVGSGVTNKLYFCYNKPLPQSQLQSDLKCLKSKLENVVNTQNLLLSYLMSSGQVNVEQLIELGDSNGNQVAHQLAGIQAGGSGGQGLDGLGLGRDSWLQELDDHLDVFGSKGDQGFRGFNFQDQNFQACEVQPEPYHVAWPEEEYVLENENLETHVLNNEQDITGQPFPKAAELQKQGVQVRDVPRHLVWIRAHSRQKDGAMTFDNPDDFEIAQTIKSLEAQQIQGEIEATGRNVILARALKNPKHGGCVRGVGSGVTNKMYFGYNKPLPQSQLQSNLKCLKSKLENVVNTQNLLLSYLMSSGQVNVEQLKELGDSNGNQVAHQLAGIQAGGSGGQGLDGLVLGRDSWLQGLGFQLASEQNKVTHQLASVQKGGSGGEELDDHLDVFGSKGDQGVRGFNFQEQNVQAFEVQPEPYHVAWHEKEYVPENENLETHVLNNEQDITGQPFPKDVAIAMKTSGKTKSFTVLARVFQNEQCVTLDYEDMLDWYMSEIVHIEGISGLYGFCDCNYLSPYAPTVEKDDDRCDYLARLFSCNDAKNKNQLFFAPFYEEEMINFSAEHRKDITKIKKKPYIKWISIECPRQANGSSDSGYYVCRYMIETVESRQMIIPDKAKKKDGILPTAAEVYESTHSVCVGNDEVELMGDKSQKVMGEYMEKLEEYKNKGIEINPDKVYLEVVGGQKKGKVYGLGNASQMYYKSDPTSQSTASSSTPSMISQLSSQVEERKKMAEENNNKVEESQKNSGRELKMC
uniref:Uncharacterized protein n=1 Tax=Chenopodium quinoa TaxID=63459 RepID=A0A803KV16_CHEQI